MSLVLTTSTSLKRTRVVFSRNLTLFQFIENSQFNDIYQKDHFMTVMKDEIDIVKELPPHLKSVNIEAIGAQVCQTYFQLAFTLQFQNIILERNNT